MVLSGLKSETNLQFRVALFVSTFFFFNFSNGAAYIMNFFLKLNLASYEEIVHNHLLTHYLPIIYCTNFPFCSPLCHSTLQSTTLQHIIQGLPLGQNTYFDDGGKGKSIILRKYNVSLLSLLLCIIWLLRQNFPQQQQLA